MIERRRGKRVTVSIPVWLRIAPRGQVVTGTACNVGRAGMLVRAAAGRMLLSARLTVLIWLPDGERESPVLLPATVVHETKYVVGLMFSEVDKRAARLLDHLVVQRERPRKETDEAGSATAPAVAAPRSRAAAAARTERVHVFAGRRD